MHWKYLSSCGLFLTLFKSFKFMGQFLEFGLYCSLICLLSCHYHTVLITAVLMSWCLIRLLLFLSEFYISLSNFIPPQRKSGQKKKKKIPKPCLDLWLEFHLIYRFTVGIVVILLDNCGVYLYLHTLIFFSTVVLFSGKSSIRLILRFLKWFFVIVNDIYL